MRLSIFCVRDDFYIFYIGLFHGSSVLPNELNCYLNKYYVHTPGSISFQVECNVSKSISF